MGKLACQYSFFKTYLLKFYEAEMKQFECLNELLGGIRIIEMVMVAISCTLPLMNAVAKILARSEVFHLNVYQKFLSEEELQVICDILKPKSNVSWKTNRARKLAFDVHQIAENVDHGSKAIDFMFNQT